MKKNQDIKNAEAAQVVYDADQGEFTITKHEKKERK